MHLALLVAWQLQAAGLEVATRGADAFRLGDSLHDLSRARGAPGLVSRKRPTSRLWHIMSFSTPPPCKSPCQNQGMWGPPCSSAARAR